MWSSLGAFAVFAAVLTVTPGLDTFVVFRVTAASGRRAGLAGAAGITLGCLAWAGASALGVTAIITASRVAFEAIRIAGVGYLCWLGIRALWHARGDLPALAPDRPSADEIGGRRAVRLGLTTNLLNPKVGAFYLSVMPQFLPAGMNPLAGALALGAVHVAEGLVWLSLVVVGVNRARRWLTCPPVRRRLELLTGVAFLAFGAGLAAEPRRP